MLKKIICSSLLASALVAPVFADTDIIVEDFESYADSAALLAAWPSVVPNIQPGNIPQADRPDNATLLIPGDTVGDDDGPYYGGTNLTKFAQFCGSTNDAGGIGNCDLAGSSGVAGGGTVNQFGGAGGAFDIRPSATQNIELKVDIGDDAFSANKRLTVGLRYVDPSEPKNGTLHDNVIEMGLFNSPSGYAFRTVLFPGATNWLAFSDPTINSPLGDGANSQFEVGRGFHTYKAVIGLNQIAFSIDLFADGLTNDPLDPVIGVGTAGVDAAHVVVGTTIDAVGFNALRFGIPSSLPSSGGTAIAAAFAAFDNISLRLVDIEVEPPVGDADFDNDGDVDGRDFLIWQRGFGLPDALNADGNTNPGVGPGLDGDVDGDDLAVWQEKYGEPGPLVSSVAVPEPAAGMLILTALGSLLAVRRR